jgi:hypothetical protein
VGHPKIILTHISEQKILMRFLSHDIPKRNKLAEKMAIIASDWLKFQRSFSPILHGGWN